jgi:hypothetical protein
MTLSWKKLIAGVALMLGAVTNSIAQVQTYCTNIAGNIACTSYDHGASSQSYCTSISGNLSCTTFDDNDDYNRVQIRNNYEAGQAIGTALGNAIVAAIEEYKAQKRMRQAKRDEWNQFIQDGVATAELSCEAAPEVIKSAPDLNVVRVGCRKLAFVFNQFLHKHQRDFAADERNLRLLDDALGKTIDKTAPPEGAPITDRLVDTYLTESLLEKAFQTIDKKQLDKKVYVGEGKDRKVW